jgi:TRAP-type mannitol/chloroaromatic compound transport system permease small subunit
MGFVVRTARAVETVIRKIEFICANVGVFLVIALMFFGTADVVGRYLFNNPITGALQVQLAMMGLIVFLLWAYTLQQKQHVSLDIFFYHYPPRAQAVMTFFAMLISLFIFAIIAWRAGILATMDWQTGKIIRGLNIPVAPFKYFVVLGASLLCLESIIQMVHLVPKIMGKNNTGTEVKEA